MRIKILAASHTREDYLLKAEGEYLKRLLPDIKLEIQELKLKTSQAQSPVEVMRLEHKELKREFETADFLVALDGAGKQLSSQKLADFVAKQMSNGCKRLVFVLGGAFGLDQRLLKSASLSLSLSELTLPHQLARLVLIEQLYRAFSIIKGRPYHK